MTIVQHEQLDVATLDSKCISGTCSFAQTFFCNYPLPEEAEAELLLAPLAKLLPEFVLLLPPLPPLLLLLLPPALLPPEGLLVAGGGGVAATGDDEDVDDGDGDGDDRLPDDILLHVEKMVEGSMKLLNPLSEPELHRQQET